MPPMPRSRVAALDSLLHEATTPAIFVNSFTNTVDAWVDALRNEGRTHSNDPVVLRLTGKVAVAACYAPSHPIARKADLAVERPMRVQPWDHMVANLPDQSMLGVPKPDELERVLHFPRVDWLHGKAGQGRHALVTWTYNAGDDGRLVMLFDKVEALALQPLPFQTWWKQAFAWSRGWAKHWNVATGDDDAGEDGDEPFVHRELARFPAQERVALQPTDMPPALLPPIREWASRGDEPGVASLQPGAYLREVIEWWIEGRWAGVAIRGLDQQAAWGGRTPEPAEDRVWTFRLFKAGRDWSLHTWQHGERSARGPRVRRRPAWMKAWTGPPIADA